MTWIRQACLGVVATFTIMAPTANAQGLTGTLAGTVQDERGGVLVGAVVRATSPAGIGGRGRAGPDDRGHFRFPVLAPGPYLLTVELPPKFASYREERISIGAGGTLDRTVVLTLAGIAESVTVHADSPASALGSGLETRFGQDYLEN